MNIFDKNIYKNPLFKKIQGYYLITYRGEHN